MIIGVIAAALISFFAGSVVTVTQPKVADFTQHAVDGGYHGEKIKSGK